MFWTIQDTIIGPVTLCDRCALMATNAGLEEREVEPFDSMSEAILIIDSLCALYGLGADSGITSTDQGPCDNCEERVA